MIRNEYELFDYLKNTFYEDLEKHTYQYDSTDCYSKKHNLEIELKVRFTHYEEMILEHSKYIDIIKKARINNRRPVYICCSPLGLYAWDLNNIVITWDKAMLPATTERQNNMLIEKKIGLLPCDKATSPFFLKQGDKY